MLNDGMCGIYDCVKAPVKVEAKSGALTIETDILGGFYDAKHL